MEKKIDLHIFRCFHPSLSFSNHLLNAFMFNNVKYQELMPTDLVFFMQMARSLKDGGLSVFN